MFRMRVAHSDEGAAPSRIGMAVRRKADLVNVPCNRGGKDEDLPYPSNASIWSTVRPSFATTAR